MIVPYGRDDEGGLTAGNACIYITLVSSNLDLAKEFLEWATTTSINIHMSYGTIHELSYSTSGFRALGIFVDSQEQLVIFKLRWQGVPNFSIESVIDMTSYVDVQK